MISIIISMIIFFLLFFSFLYLASFLDHTSMAFVKHLTSETPSTTRTNFDPTTPPKSSFDALIRYVLLKICTNSVLDYFTLSE